MSNQGWPSLKVKILLHYYTTPATFPERSPAASKFEVQLMNLGFIESSNGHYYECTYKGRLFVERLLSAAARIANSMGYEDVGPADVLREAATREGARISEGEPVVMRTKWHYGIPFDVAEPAVTYHTEYRAGRPPLDVPHWPRALYTERDADRRYFGMHRDGTIDPQWLSRYNNFKRLGTNLYSDGRINRREWRHVVDIVWGRTNGLQNGLLARDLYIGLFNICADERRSAKPLFNKLRRYAIHAHNPPPVPK
jgi:hypothetical protein